MPATPRALTSFLCDFVQLLLDSSLHSGSQLEQFCSPGDIWQSCLQTLLVITTRNEGVGCSWHLVGRYQNYLFSTAALTSSYKLICLVIKLCSIFFVTPQTVACQALLSMRFPRQEYWSGLPFPSVWYLPDPGIKPEFLASPAVAGRFFTTSATWEAPLKSVPSSPKVRCYFR